MIARRETPHRLRWYQRRGAGPRQDNQSHDRRPTWCRRHVPVSFASSSIRKNPERRTRNKSVQAIIQRIFFFGSNLVMNDSVAKKGVFAEDEVVQKLLGDVQWDIEFSGFLSNHVKHAVIALKGLDASSERISEYWNEYTATTPYGIALDATSADFAEKVAQDEVSFEEFKALVGKKREFSKLCAYFRRQVDELGADGAVAKHAFLFDGLIGGLTHGIIHCGWGLASGSQWMTIEGLAYLAFTYVDLKGGDRFSKEDEEEEPSLPGSTPLESLLALADRREEFLALAKDVKADDARRWPKESFHPELVVAGFQWQVAKIVDAGHPTFYAKPEWLSSGYDALLEDMYELASVLHVVSKGNFLVLHLVTSLWGLEQALMAVEDDTTKLHALRVFWTALQALVVTSGGGYPSRDDIQAVVDDHAAAGKKI
mmetsp:Transcript_15262/g.49869  ORF Transcript_15262/g.49869 Transcript_15262/m.49869 type:complete len:427 (+) Transcript_15262:691-1971(+)